ncbi:MAG TPA: HAMP domain-containing sensor histidine kinase [Gemmatimonadaceae bacterium]|nr:HAMP domain-containing sensor histidine kinase [Gemmatimonadaceae bacterium]
MTDSALDTQAGETETTTRERMATLGTLAAGLAHELNNPAIAIGRSVDLLRSEIAGVDPVLRQIASHSWSEDELRFLARLGATTERAQSSTAAIDVVDRTDREETLINWLDQHEVKAPPELATALVDRGVTPEELAALVRGCSPDVISDAMAWLSRLTLIRQLLDDVARSAARIGDLVRAVKSHAYTDMGRRTVDVHESIESSLTLMGYKLREARAKLAREYDRSLPPIETYGTELNQLWTNLLDNAADALTGKEGERTISLRTTREGAVVRIDVADSGPGIPPNLAAKIFEPHFTTKAAGKGTGLGLDIVRRIVAHHGGTIACESDATGARFVVRIPLVQSSDVSK